LRTPTGISGNSDGSSLSLSLVNALLIVWNGVDIHAEILVAGQYDVGALHHIPGGGSRNAISLRSCRAKL
jgi:hypothetical protein